jgi:hypothetical protein
MATVYFLNKLGNTSLNAKRNGGWGNSLRQEKAALSFFNKIKKNEIQQIQVIDFLGKA